ncbi:MAG: glycosyltransferase family 2 protein, partial [Thermoanaerobaculia bacterium]|nr:glycosyltransferase family 2 protein [Thermoanaerobaculia bacterium]
MIDPRRPDYSNTPVCDRRPAYAYAPAEADRAPAVSIVTPFFDAGETIGETAASVLRQSLVEWEWIVVDDGSRDPASRAALRELQAADRRVRVVAHETNRGPGAARNTGVAQARAPFVLLLDSDDLLEPTAAETWLWYLESHPAAGFVGGPSVAFGAETDLSQGGFHEGDRFLRVNRARTTSMLR